MAATTSETPITVIIRIDIPEYGDKKTIELEDYDLSDFLYCLSLEFLKQGHRVINGYDQKITDKTYDVRLLSNFNPTYNRIEQDLPGTVVVSLVDKILKPTDFHGSQLSWYSVNHEYYRRMTQSDGDIFYTKFIVDFWNTITVYNKPKLAKYNVIPPAIDSYILENFWSEKIRYPSISEGKIIKKIWLAMVSNPAQSAAALEFFSKNSADEDGLMFFVDNLENYNSIETMVLTMRDNNVMNMQSKWDRIALWVSDFNMKASAYWQARNSDVVINLTDGLGTPNIIYSSDYFKGQLITNNKGSNFEAASVGSLVLEEDKSQLLLNNIDAKEYQVKQATRKNKSCIETIAQEYIGIFKNLLLDKKQNKGEKIVNINQKTHSEAFFDFLNTLDKEGIRYVIIRGFGKFPISPDTDVDLVYHLDDHEKYTILAKKHLIPYNEGRGSEWTSMGSGEWCEMRYSPCKTPGLPDQNLPNGCFRIDAYNSLHFKTPYNNFTTFWTVDKKYNDEIIASRRKIVENYGSYYLPQIEDEVTLLVARNVLDNKKRPMWNKKHKERIGNILEELDRTILQDKISKLFPNSKKIVDLVYNKQFESIMDYALGRAK